MFPTTIQFSHALSKHEYTASNNLQKTFLDTQKTNCSIFHHQINVNTIDFSTKFSLTEPFSEYEKIYFVKNQISTFNFHYKSSRAPPTYC